MAALDFLKKASRPALGYLCLSSVIFLWVFSSILIQAIFADEDFSKPFFLTYFSTSTFSLYLLFLLVKYLFYRLKSLPHPIARVMTLGSQTSIKHTAKISLMFCPIWFAANYTYNYGLEETSISSSSILSNTSAIFTFVFSYFLLKEGITLWKVLAVVITFGGILTITFSDKSDGDDGEEGFWGDVLSLLSSVFYGVYATFLKWKMPEEDDRQGKVNLGLFFGLVGVFNVVLLGWLFPVLDYTGVEVFELPSKAVLGMLFLNAFFGTVLSDFFWAKSVLLLSPLITTVGMSLTIPASMIMDFVLHGSTFHILYVFGSVMVVVGFVIITISNEKLSKETQGRDIKDFLSESESPETEHLLATSQVNSHSL